MKRLQTKVSADMSRYTENFFLGMSARQTIFGIAGVAVVALSYVFLHVPGFVAIGLGFPLFIAGFCKPDGLPVEKYLRYWIESHMVRPTERVYEEENELYAFLWKGRLCGRRVKTTGPIGRSGSDRREKKADRAGSSRRQKKGGSAEKKNERNPH